MEEWTHFTRLLEDGYIGKTNFFYAVCKHCQRAYDGDKADKTTTTTTRAREPERLVGRREKLRKHLLHCPHFHGELPPIVARVPVRGPRVVLPSAAAIAAAAATAAGDNNQLSSVASALAVAASVAAQKTKTGSSRLGLDEWQYFTRLERRAGSGYYYARCNFCHAAFESASKALQAAMVPVVVVGRKANMQTHLAKCAHIPKNLLVLVPKTEEATESTEPTDDSGRRDVDTDGSSSGDNDTRPATKRLRVASPSDDVSTATATTTTTVDAASQSQSLVEFTLEHRLPFEWLESESAQKLFRAWPTGATGLPTAMELRTTTLDEVYERVAMAELAGLKEPLPPIAGLPTTAAVEAPATWWPVMMHCTMTRPSSSRGGAAPVIQCELTNGRSFVPVEPLVKTHRTSDGKTIPAVAHSHGLEVARWLDAHLWAVTQSEHIMPAVVVLPFNTVFDRAVKLLRARWPRAVFVFDFLGLLHFCVHKLLASDDIQELVTALSDLWRIADDVRRASPVADPFHDWQAFSHFLESLVDDDSMFMTNAELHAAVDKLASRSVVERTAALLSALRRAHESASSNQLSLADTMRHVRVLYSAATGFETFQRALEVVWAEMEQPLFVLAHALHPHLRLANLASADMTKLSKLSDSSVAYFTSLVGTTKPSSLRGEVTSYLHTSQEVFSAEFVAEFAVLDDYFRYLSDDYAALSVLMRLLLSFSSVLPPRLRELTTPSDDVERGASVDERVKMAFLADHWGLQQRPHVAPTATGASSSSPGFTSSRAALKRWSDAVTRAASERGTEFALLERRYAIGGVVSRSASPPVVSAAAVSATDSDSAEPLPCVPTDDDVVFPPTFLSGDRARTITLKALVKAVEVSS